MNRCLTEITGRVKDSLEIKSKAYYKMVKVVRDFFGQC